jgi:hypothetical protein
VYEALRRLVVDSLGGVPGPNYFLKVSLKSVEDAEAQLGCRFPPQLRQFYLTIGHGQIIAPIDRPDLEDLDRENRIEHPLEVVDIYRGRSKMARPREFEAGEIPIFTASTDYHFVVFPNGREPDAVFSVTGQRIAPTFAEFVASLAKDPCFYHHLWTHPRRGGA